MTPIIVIGCGAASLLLLHLFSHEGVPPHHITIIDPTFEGGDLQRCWAPIRSNTPWMRLGEAIGRLNPAWKELAKSNWNPSETVPLFALIRTLRESIRSYLERCVLVYDTAIAARYTSCWEVECPSAGIQKGNLLFLCVGSEPKSLQLPIPSIPLAKALTSQTLRQYVEPHNRVLVFGCQHSGTLVINSLVEIGCEHITVIHRHSNNANPFLFARQGEYDGIKEEAENIADKLLRETPAGLEFVNHQEIGKVAKALRTADWVVYAMGFTPRVSCRIYSGNDPVSIEAYDATTGRLPMPSGVAWGFGIAFPNRAPDGIHYDVSLHSFADHIANQKSTILEQYRSVISAKITNT